MRKILIGIVMILMLLSLTGCNSWYWKEYSSNECIEEKWIKGLKDEDQKYLVSTENGEVFQIKDSFWKWQFRSSDLYAQLKPGKCYDVYYHGWRLGFFSSYKNIHKIELKD